MATNRSYNDGCGMAHALDLVGERWALLVVRELVFGPKRYTDLRADLPGISTNVLSNRLSELERVGVVWRHRLARPAGAWVYELTDWGHELEPIIRELGRWGAKSPFLPGDAPLSAASLVLSLRTNFTPGADDEDAACYELRLGEERFHAKIADRRIELARGGAEQPDVVIDTAPGTLAELIYGSRDLASAVRAGDVRLWGEKSEIERFLTLFSLPEPAQSTSSLSSKDGASLRETR